MPLFTSEAQAFAAAEETYRAYVDALNQRRENPSATPDPTEFLIGSALEVDLETQRQLEQSGLRIAGDTIILRVERGAISTTFDSIDLTVCLDSSGTLILDSSGVDVTPTDRSTVAEARVTVVALGERLAIEASETVSGSECSKN